MQSAVVGLLAASCGDVTLSGWSQIFGGNARRAWAFDAISAEQGTLPCILLSQAAVTHVEADPDAEFGALAALNGSDVRAPRALAIDREGVVTGSPAIILERVAGEAGAVEFLAMADDAGRGLSQDLAKAAGELHRFDWTSSGFAQPDHGPDGDPVRAQIEHWHDQFFKHRLEPHPVLAWLFDWLRDHAPDPVRLSIVHGDMRPGNFLYLDGKVSAILDWEMAHIGDPAEDIAWIYRALWSPAKFLPADDFLAIHAQHAGFAVPRRDFAYYRIFSEVKFAVISLAASHSFASGGTPNLRHIDRAAKVPECLRNALEWIAAEDWETSNAAA